ncbi:MAG: hypothetical protein AAGK23_08430 [Pseudomonadota bacterium]
MPMKKFVILALAIASVPLSPAVALTADEARECQVLASSFGPKKATFEAKSAERDTLALAAETAGETWENAEALRNFSADSAAEADTARQAYDAALASFDVAEAEVLQLGLQLNDEFIAFNSRCASK